MSFRKTHRLGLWTAAAVLAITARAQAQGIFTQFGTAASELSASLPLIIGVVCFGLGGFLLIYGGYSLYKHFRHQNHGQGSLALSAASFVSGFIILGIVAFAALGTTTFTGGAPTAGTGGAVTF